MRLQVHGDFGCLESYRCRLLGIALLRDGGAEQR